MVLGGEKRTNDKAAALASLCADVKSSKFRSAYEGLGSANPGAASFEVEENFNGKPAVVGQIGVYMGTDGKVRIDPMGRNGPQAVDAGLMANITAGGFIPQGPLRTALLNRITEARKAVEGDGRWDVFGSAKHAELRALKDMEAELQRGAAPAKK